MLKDCLDKIWLAYISPSIYPFDLANIDQASIVRAEVVGCYGSNDKTKPPLWSFQSNRETVKIRNYRNNLTDIWWQAKKIKYSYI